MVGKGKGLKFDSRPPCSISHDILLQQTEAVVLPLRMGIMIRLKALTAEIWTKARRWGQFRHPITSKGWREKCTIGSWQQQGGRGVGGSWGKRVGTIPALKSSWFNSSYCQIPLHSLCLCCCFTPLLIKLFCRSLSVSLKNTAVCFPSRNVLGMTHEERWRNE